MQQIIAQQTIIVQLLQQLSNKVMGNVVLNADPPPLPPPQFCPHHHHCPTPPPIQSADWHAGQEEGKDEIQPPQAPPSQALPPRVMQDNNDKLLTLPPLPTTITKSTMQ
jgi:hypothetical protein